MDSYVHQLIEQFRESATRVPPPSSRSKDFDLEDEGEMEDFQYVEENIYGTPQPLSEILGIEKIYLPEDFILSDNQIEMLASEMETLWNAYHFYPDFPVSLPARQRYRSMIDVWDDERVFVGVGEVPVIFCDYEEDMCPFPGYCSTCEEIAQQMAFDEEQEKMHTGKKFKYDLHSLIPTREETEKFMRDRRKEEIKEIITSNHSDDYISGIHNYCDRWCERCVFTKRCGSFALEGKIYSNEEEKSIDNQAFWENLSLMFEVTMELLSDKMEEFGVLPEELEDIDIFSDNETEKHPLEKMATDHSMKVHNWLNMHDQDMELVLSGTKDKTGISYKEATETILWYNFFIPVKLNRSLSGLLQKRDEELDEHSRFDINGSAKVALIAIERSISAWGVLLLHFTRLEDEIFDFIKTLKHIQNSAKTIFPKAMGFIRPGLDEQ